MFDPNLPQENTPADAVQMRSQLNGLKAIIDAILTVTAAQVDSTTTLPQGSSRERECERGGQHAALQL
jgi:hypothetical protein